MPVEIVQFGAVATNMNGFDATTTAPGGEPTENPPVHPDARLKEAGAIIHQNVLWAMGLGLVPFPVADLVAIIAVQVKLLKQLSDLYRVPFREDLAKKLVASLLVGFGGVGFGIVLASSLSKLIPAIGTTIGVIAVPVVGGALTHATGRVFVMHFESGGTILDFDPKRMRAHFRAEFEAAKITVTEVHRQTAGRADTTL